MKCPHDPPFCPIVHCQVSRVCPSYVQHTKILIKCFEETICSKVMLFPKCDFFLGHPVDGDRRIRRLFLSVQYFLQMCQNVKESRSQKKKGFKSLKVPRDMGSKCLLWNMVFSKRKNSLSLSPEEGPSCYCDIYTKIK